MLLKDQEWNYMVMPEELYFTSEHRYPLDRVVHTSLDRSKSDTFSLLGGLVLLFIDFS